MANEQNYERIRLQLRQHADRLARLEAHAGIATDVPAPSAAAPPRAGEPRREPRQQPVDNRSVPASITVRRVSGGKPPTPAAAPAAPAVAPTAGSLLGAALGFNAADLALLVKDAVAQAVSSLAPAAAAPPAPAATAPTEPAKPPAGELDWLDKEAGEAAPPAAVRG